MWLRGVKGYGSWIWIFLSLGEWEWMGCLHVRVGCVYVEQALGCRDEIGSL